MTQPTPSNEAEPLSNKQEKPLSENLQEIVTMVQSVAFDCKGDLQNLLSLLRTLESLHRQIRSDLFEPSLPNTRNNLYEILKDIEENGGWPHIERMKLQKLLQNFSIKIKNTDLSDDL
ncbi:MAG TPA: hypothetical protein DCF68_03695 [Cyanothece sp. UBA12306]|nr:hypothetical protein [Cyanothece sp. UBA12306]